MLAAALSIACPLGCDDSARSSPDATPFDAAADARADAPPSPCGADDDFDGDGIANRFEGAADTDHDDIPDARDPDSDDDGIPDSFEASAGRPRTCATPPVDSDMDGIPDFQDTDSNNDTLSDAMEAAPSQGQQTSAPLKDCLQDDPPGVRPMAVTAWTCHPYDTDGDGTPDYADGDIDDDRVLNPLEISPGGAMSPTDTDGDGLPDFRDADSDGDTIADLHEGSLDRDGDGLANFRDRDSDGDSPELSTANIDALEAGDADPRTPPVECARELDLRTLTLGVPRPDGVPDYLDTDSDNDGLSDGEEVLAGTDRCNPDTDGDGQLDSLEVAWCRASMRARCALDRAVTIPSDEVWIALPFQGATAQRTVEFSTRLRVADVFFLLDTSARAEGVRAAFQAAFAAPRAGVVGAVRARFDDAYIGAGHFEDFNAVAPMMGAAYGSADDRPWWPLCAGPSGTPGCRPGWGITMQPMTRAADVQATVSSLPAGVGGDPPGSQVEAIYQSLTGEGLFAGDADSVCAASPGRAPCWVAPMRCAEGTRGGACFRRGSLPVVVLVTGSDFHNGAPAMPGDAHWSPYAGIAPTPHSFTDVVSALSRTAARVVGVNAHRTARCESARMVRVPGEPCFDLLALARASGSVDRAGRPLVYDLPPSSTAAEIAGALDAAFGRLARDVPLDVRLTIRGQATNPGELDATRFIRTQTPTCLVGTMGPTCWTPPAGVVMSAAVARVDMNGFYDVIPGTRLRFTLSLRNENITEGAPVMTVYRVYLDAVGDGSVLDTREINIVVPAAQSTM